MASKLQQRTGSLVLALAVGAVLVWACSNETTSGPSGETDAAATVKVPSAPTTAPTTTATTPTGGDAAPADSGADAGDPTAAVTCKTIHAGNATLPSGMYAIDLDGTAAAYPPITVYCDMTFAGGGWTMIQSFTGADSPLDLTGPGDAGVLVRSPEPGKLGGLADWIVQKLAGDSSQVHIRLSFQSDAGADAGTWVTSRDPDAGAVTNVIKNLRNLDVLTKGTDGGFDEWGGPSATAAKLSWVPLYGGGPATCANPVDATKYPSIYWACGNFTSMNIYAPQALCRWQYTPSTGNDPMEVFVRWSRRPSV